MLDDTTGSFALRFALAALVVAVALAAFFAIVTLIRRRNPGSGTFLGHARGKHSRLKVLDSAVLDARRRLVLIRRDNVEHLLLIGGPTDVIIESGIDAAYEPRETVQQDTAFQPVRQEATEEPFDDDDFDDEPEVASEPEPLRQPVEKPVARAPLRDSLRSMFRRDKPEEKVQQTAPPSIYQEWEDDEDDDFTDDKLDLTADLFGEDDYPRRADEPPTGTIRPVTVSRLERLAPPMPQIQLAPEPAVSAEEAAIARELESARRRQIAGPAVPAAPQPAPPQSDFDRVLEREMEEKLEAAKRQAQAAPPRPVVQQPRRDPALPRITGASPDQRSLDNGLARIFGEGTPKSNGER